MSDKNHNSVFERQSSGVDLLLEAKSRLADEAIRGYKNLHEAMWRIDPEIVLAATQVSRQQEQLHADTAKSMGVVVQLSVAQDREEAARQQVEIAHDNQGVQREAA